MCTSKIFCLFIQKWYYTTSNSIPPRLGGLSIREVTKISPPASFLILQYSSSSCDSSSGVVSRHGMIFFCTSSSPDLLFSSSEASGVKSARKSRYFFIYLCNTMSIEKISKRRYIILKIGNSENIRKEISSSDWWKYEILIPIYKYLRDCHTFCIV